MQRLTEVFTVGEGFQLLRGDFNLPDFFKRISQVIKNEFEPLGGRRQLVEKIGAETAKYLHLPEKCKESVIEHFDPVLVCNDISKAVATGIIIFIKNFETAQGTEKSDEQFAEEMTNQVREQIKKVINEIEDGFTNGYEGISVFLEENLKAFIGQMCAPH
jgi:hypothetical protein